MPVLDYHVHVQAIEGVLIRWESRALGNFMGSCRVKLRLEGTSCEWFEQLHPS